jgi:hypothetical protein
MGNLLHYALVFLVVALIAAVLGLLFFLEKNAATDGLLRDLRKLLQQPGRRHFQLDIIVSDVNVTCSHLSKGPHPKTHPLPRPNLLLNHEHRKAGGGLTQRRFDAAQGPLFAELVRDLNDQGLRH